MNVEKSINLFEMKKSHLTWFFIKHYFFKQFINNFSALLLCEINIMDIFDMGNFFQIFVISRSTEILIEPKFCFGMYVRFSISYSLLSSHFISAVELHFFTFFLTPLL